MKGITKILLLLGTMMFTSCVTNVKELNQPPIQIKKTNVISIRTTAYTHVEADHKDFGKQTAIGTTLKAYQSCAADWSIFPLGTRLKIAGNIYIVDDYGSFACKQYKPKVPTVDIYQGSRSAMNKWGVKLFDNVEVVKWGSFDESARILRSQVAYGKQARILLNRVEEKL